LLISTSNVPNGFRYRLQVRQRDRAGGEACSPT
jgi:hypothetical protein